ncbi:MAG: UDP-N-acetylmuramoyl-L-alanine--D-glutamate ligase [Denitrovibrio sp.]|nr:MAG: UDP-N-acetylmuramoyl-L-alanine--D-glutamate ligase [Denitrovibrio sp.]
MKAAIIGYGKSGKAAENILRSNGFTDIDIFDDGNADAKKIADFKDEYEKVVVSPGIDLRKMTNAPKEYTSEIELAHSKKPADAAVVAITGTNGKSTVTTLTSQILKKCGVEAVACGNIGLTYGEAVTGWAFGCYVVELSSFQTGVLKEFSADCVIVTNLAEDHLDRYLDMDDYAGDKMNLLKFLDKDGRLIIEDEEYLEKKVSSYKGEIVKIDSEVIEGKLDFGTFYVDTKKFPLKGKHNIVNLSFALLAVDKLCGLKGDVTHLIDDLRGLEHRCEHVAIIKGVEYINDSKGTNIHSTLTALKGFDEEVVVILGGKDKNGDFSELIDVINEKTASVIAYGGAGEKIYKTLDGAIRVPLYKAARLEDAVAKAFEVAEAGQKVVLSPGCASFDQHRSFEHRGTHFKELVEEIKNKEEVR